MTDDNYFKELKEVNTNSNVTDFDDYQNRSKRSTSTNEEIVNRDDSFRFLFNQSTYMGRKISYQMSIIRNWGMTRIYKFM